jgi:hypothetical protein
VSMKRFGLAYSQIDMVDYLVLSRAGRKGLQCRLTAD